MNNINVAYYSSRAQKSQAGSTEQPSDRALPSSWAGQGPGGPPPCAPRLRGSGPLSSRGIAPAPRPLQHLLLAARFHSPNASSGAHLLPLQGPLLTLRPCHNSPPLSMQGLPCEETYLQVRGRRCINSVYHTRPHQFTCLQILAIYTL